MTKTAVVINHRAPVIVDQRFVVKVSANTAGGVMCIVFDQRQKTSHLRYGHDPSTVAEWLKWLVQSAP